jgi:selenocysteine-specific elongation factor
VRCGKVAFARTAIEAATDVLRELEARTGPFTASQAREALGTTRRYTIPLLEHLDRTGVTTFDGQLRRCGDLRPPARSAGSGGARDG